MREALRDRGVSRNRLRIRVLAALLGVLAGCGGGAAVTEDDGGAGDDAWLGDVPGGDDGDARRETRDAGDVESPWDVPLAPGPTGCGNGVLEDGEECDDRNRRNGDGCDWLCRLGDGDPPPAPDPGVEPYAPSGEPIVMPGIEPFGTTVHSLPLVWTGSEFATALHEVSADGRLIVRFRRFDREARPLDADWVFDAATWRSDGIDLVWTGEGFGLFYAVFYEGIYYLRLDRTGKPIREPVLVEPDPTAQYVAADLAAGGFALAWFVYRGGALPGCDPREPASSTRMRLVGLDGSTSGPPLEVDSATTGGPDIATGDDGFGVAIAVTGTAGHPECATRFVQVSADLSRIEGGGVLSDSDLPEVKWADGRWVQSWLDANRGADGDGFAEACVARFAPGGMLDGPPLCDRLGWASEDWGMWGPKLAAGDGGLALVAAAFSGEWLFFLRTDSMGRAVGVPRDVYRPHGSIIATYPAVNTVWAMDGFAVLFYVNELEGGSDWTDKLYLRWFTAAT